MFMDIRYISSFLVLLLSLFAVSCNDDKEVVDWSEERIVEISPELVSINTFGVPDEVNGMLLKVQGENKWTAYPATFIEDFQFAPGYRYTLKVEIVHLGNPPQDGYDVRYKLISMLSKTAEEQ